MAIVRNSIRILRNEGLQTLTKEGILYLYNFIVFGVLLLIRFLISFVPRKKGLWVFGDGYRGSPRRGQNSKYLFLQLSGNSDSPNLVWVSHSDEEVQTLRANAHSAYDGRSRQGLYTLLRAEKIFLTAGMDFWWPLTGGAEIVQLYHGNALKKIGPDKRWGNPTLLPRLKRRLVRHNWDYYIMTSKNPPSDIQRRIFNVDTEDALVTGYPRTDIFYKEIDHLGLNVDTDLVNRLQKLDDEQTVFLYAPTFRRYYRDTEKTPLTESGLDLENINQILERCDGYLVLKLHPNTEVNTDISKFDRIFVAESGTDIYPLLKETDCLIADYSSIIVDYLLLDRPIIFFPYDLQQYSSKEGLMYTYETISPGYMAKDAQGLYSAVKNVAEGNDLHESEREFLRTLFYDYTDGKSAERIKKALNE